MPENVDQRKIPPGQVLLLAEPIFTPLTDDNHQEILLLPRGAQGWVSWYREKFFTPQSLAGGLLEEYVGIGQALKEIKVPFHMILAHRDEIDEKFFLGCTRYWEVRGLSLHRAISSTCFPRDMMVDFNGQILINPQANFNFPDNSGKISRLGEGGAILKVNKKVLIPDPVVLTSKERQRYRREAASLSGFQYAFLPWPAGWQVNLTTGENKVFSSNHLDRVAAMITGSDQKDYLLVDTHYLNDSRKPWGSYKPLIEDACNKLDVNLIEVIDSADTLYALNLVQFHDGSVLITDGAPYLEGLLREIVGLEKVFTTAIPIVLYPLLRHGGIRCMTLFAPEKIVGPSVRSHMRNLGYSPNLPFRL